MTPDGLADTPARSPAPINSGFRRGLVVLGITLAPALLAVVLTPGFTTQDGPAHVYSARILNASLLGNSPYAATFRVAWEPLPNWAGHLLTMAAVAIWSPEVANRVVTALTLFGFGAAVVWLRVVVAGRSGVEVAALLAALLALNVTWLLGFTSFLLGATLAPITLGVWWLGRDRLGFVWSTGLAALLGVGYFCHPISLGLTLAGLLVLATLTPGPTRWVRFAWTSASLIPLIPLGLAYRAITKSGGRLEPVWDHWSPSLAGAVSQVGWVDPLSLAAKTSTPFEVTLGPVPSGLLAPAVWVAIALVTLVGLSWRRRSPERWGWLIGAGGLLAIGLVSPDTLGVKHGHFLPQRIVLLGLVALVPWLDLRIDRLGAKGALVALMIALTMQSAFVWDYAANCRERVSPFLRVADRFGPLDRSGTLLNAIRGRFRANPLLHADGLIAAQTDAVFWTNYETAQYYFPVKVRSDVDHPVATRFEQVAILDEPRDAERRAHLWTELLHDQGPRISKIVEWRFDPILDAVTDRDYEVTDQEGPLRVWSRRLELP